MARIAGIQFIYNEEGVRTHVIVDLKKYGEKIKPYLQEIGAVDEDEFEKKWAKGGLTVEKLRKSVHKTIRKVPKKQ
ncbi:MAG: hypothetical protein Q8M29_12520 [Bacteroidota bacterium]|nr:hypothetical protein [Bacteroidota bacterium]